MNQSGRAVSDLGLGLQQKIELNARAMHKLGRHVVRPKHFCIAGNQKISYADIKPVESAREIATQANNIITEEQLRKNRVNINAYISSEELGVLVKAGSALANRSQLL